MTRGGWRKSSYSSSSQGNCVEVLLTSQNTHIRDSKNADGPKLAVGRSTWATFLTTFARPS